MYIKEASPAWFTYILMHASLSRTTTSNTGENKILWLFLPDNFDTSSGYAISRLKRIRPWTNSSSRANLSMMIKEKLIGILQNWLSGFGCFFYGSPEKCEIVSRHLNNWFKPINLNPRRRGSLVLPHDGRRFPSIFWAIIAAVYFVYSVDSLASFSLIL